MNHKGFWKLLIPFLVIFLLAASWLANVPPRPALAESNTRYYLPIIQAGNCIFSDYKPGELKELEPNGRFSQANGPIPPDTPTWGCFFKAPDIDDVYYFVLTIPSTIEINLRNIPEGEDYDLVLYDKNTKRFAYSNNPGNEDELIVIDELMVAGRYYIQVNNYKRTASKEPYKLVVNYEKSYSCDNPVVVADLFPQLGDGYSFYAQNPAFQCQVEFNNIHNGFLALRLEYEAGEQDGFWGIAKRKPFDASQFGDICFWAFAETVPQSFTLNLKDTDGIEKPSPVINITQANVWSQKCLPLGHYKTEGVDLAQLESFNVHFNKGTGDATVWVEE